MRRVSSVDILMEEAFHAETILALWDRYVAPFFALSQAKAIFKAGRAQLPPANATFRLVWFLGKKHYNNCAYIRFNFPVQEPLYPDNAWDRPQLIEDLLASGGPTIVKFWDMWFCPFSLCGFSFQVDFIFLSIFNFLFFFVK